MTDTQRLDWMLANFARIGRADSPALLESKFFVIKYPVGDPVPVLKDGQLAMFADPRDAIDNAIAGG